LKVLAALALAAPLAEAQVAPDAGSILRQQRPPVLDLPPKPPPALQIEQPTRPQPPAPPDTRFVLSEVRFTGQTVFTEDELFALVQDLVGTQVGLADLEQAAARISRYYRARGFVVARAYLPAQDIRDGLVEIAVLEGRIGRVVIENRSRVRDELIAARVTGLQGRIVREENIDRVLRLTYEMAGIGSGSQAALEPGADVGGTDLVLQLNSAPFATGSVELDNHGNRFTGGNRLSGQIDFHSPTGSGDLLSLRATEGDPDLGLYRLYYQLPVGANGLRLGADLSHVRYRLGRDFAALEASGTADTRLAFASYPLALARTYSAHARISFQQSDIQNRIGATASVTDKSSRLGTFAITGDWEDAFAGGGTNAVSVSHGVGDLNIKSPDARAIDDATARTSGGFQKSNLSLTRLQRLTERVSLYLLFAGQKANKNLDSSEKLILGGPNGVKAYPQGEAPGDSGYLLNVEMRYELPGDWIPGRTQLLGLVDTGEVSINENPFVPGANRRRLSSAGFGVNWIGAQDFNVRLLVAHRLGNSRATSDTDAAARAWLQLIKRF